MRPENGDLLKCIKRDTLSLLILLSFSFNFIRFRATTIIITTNNNNSYNVGMSDDVFFLRHTPVQKSSEGPPFLA